MLRASNSCVLQAEAAECGLTCLLMVLRSHGRETDLFELRRRFPTSIKGVDLGGLMRQASDLGLSARAVRLEVEDLPELKLPAIAHWDLNHFVVIDRVRGGRFRVLDPARGERWMRASELSPHFTGVALELTPTADLAAPKARQRISLESLGARIKGIGPALAQIALVAFLLELIAVVAPLYSQLVIDEALSSGNRDLLTVLALGFGLLVLIQAAVGCCRSWMVIYLSHHVSLQWQTNVFRHLIRLPAAYFEKRQFSEVASRFGSIASMQKTLTTTAIEAVLDGLMAVIALGMMLLYSVKLAGMVLLAVLLYAVLRWATYSTFRQAASERLQLAAKEQGHFLETLRCINSLKLFGHEQERQTRWQSLIVDIQNRDARTSKLTMWFQVANVFIFGLENILFIWLGATLVLKGQQSGNVTLTVGMLFALMSYKGQFTDRVSKLIDYSIDIKMLGMHAERLADIAYEAPEPRDAVQSDLAHLQPEIELRNVSFRYTDREPWVLRNVNLRIEAGESIAITGPSGGGKTTMLKIVLGLLEPVEGEVLYGGVSIRDLGLGNYRRQIGTVMQEDGLLTGSLRDNISFFDRSADDGAVIAAAEAAQVHQEICRMPMGYQTLVGDMGAGLSGGQRQRVLLARAIFKRPRVLALDEATSHLDVSNERAVSAALAGMNVTRLMIAHRPETIAGAQRVVQLREGSLIEVARQVPTSSHMTERSVSSGERLSLIGPNA